MLARIERSTVPPRTLVALVAIFGGVLVLGVAVGACDPLFATQHTQALSPAPRGTCIDSALKSSPQIARLTLDTSYHERAVLAAYRIVVRDSTHSNWEGLAEFGGTGDSTWIRVSYAYMNFATPPRGDRARWDGQAREIVEAVRSRCAPSTPTHVTCRSVGGLGGQRGACSSVS